MAVVAPVVIAFLPGFGVEALGGMLAGVTVTGVLMAIFQSNAGGAWDNAKKSFEEGVEINGKMYYKKSEPHKAAVVGDTVGDPFKDTSGPSLNILLKLMSVVALVIAPLLVVDEPASTGKADKSKVKIETVSKASTDTEAFVK
jgi:K(+)-stimulated pyrophosphate-energized sodium pump